ncbi:universal stress protein [Mastigocoleus sp. MO_188.B34]|uniref:universal stress protein n=1 Tax=Mastigocoleus sp. MO_188.B34 TaxID=3036635 RepID=UPI00260895BE|nr:universal stress protein [Mastigocoleus sp. MO_188.B34]MDJ0693466.1 universal stress protein [Mastigocoleus sp. MO_188.B34]
MFHKLLVAIDTSDMSQYVFDEAVSLAKTNNARLLLLHVLNPLDEQYIDGTVIEPIIFYSEYQGENDKTYIDWQKLKEKRLKWLQSQRDRAKKLGMVAESNQHIGEASRTICNVARSWGADLIVIGRRGRSGLSEFFLGSVSNYVLHHASCSVLIVQGPLIQTNGRKVSQTKTLETETETKTETKAENSI